MKAVRFLRVIGHTFFVVAVMVILGGMLAYSVLMP
jgi:hypothetical protein